MLNTLPPAKNGVGPSRVVLPVGVWSTALDFLCQRFPHISQQQWQERIAQGLVLDEKNQPISKNTAYQAHTSLYYYRALAAEPLIPFDAQIVFQNEMLLVVDKPHFLPVIPAGRYVQQTLLVRLKRQLGIETLAPVHRLDSATAGLVLFTLQPSVRAAYHGLFKQGLVHKIYHAIAPSQTELALPLIYQSRIERGTQFFTSQEVAGEPNSQTQIEKIEENGEWARYQLTPKTGKKHQLRLHMATLGLPIKNDQWYPQVTSLAEVDDYTKPLQLLAKSLSFKDPITGKTLYFESNQTLS